MSLPDCGSVLPAITGAIEHLKKKTLTVGDQQLVIAELNTAQVKEITASKPDGVDDNWFETQKWRTIVLSLNNAQKPPNKQNPLGSATDPQSADDIMPTLGYGSSGDVWTEILTLSGLKPVASGESKATGDPSTSGTSTAA